MVTCNDLPPNSCSNKITNQGYVVADTQPTQQIDGCPNQAMWATCFEAWPTHNDVDHEIGPNWFFRATSMCI